MNIFTSSNDEGQHVIKIKGRFDFNLQAEFRQAYEQLPQNDTFVLDFTDTEYMDSSALGMLLLLRDYAGGDNAAMELVGCTDEVRNILEISNFKTLFKMD